MSIDGQHRTEDSLTLRSRLEEIAQVAGWVERLALRHHLPVHIQSAVNLCLEEALANVIRHGFRGAPDRSVTVHFTRPREGFVEFIVEDEAPRFNPLDAPELPALHPRESLRVGGQGIRFLRRFADSLAYESRPTGNRLHIGFSAGDSPASGK